MVVFVIIEIIERERFAMLAAVAIMHLEGIDPADLQRLAPAERRRLADRLRHLADIADPRKPAVPPKGVLADLRNGERPL
jgi:hypothetical protein